MYKIVQKTKIWFSFSIIIILIGIGFMATKGLEFGIDFTGGAVVQINMDKAFNKAEVEAIVKKYASDETSNVLDNTILEVKSSKLTTDDSNKLFAELKEKYKLKDAGPKSENNIKASLGTQMRNNAILAVLIANALILVYVAIRFEFKFGLAAIVALLHDVLITLSVYAIFRIPLDSAFIAAILTILGYSMSDTIVVFDRIRENQKFMLV
jgi:preprotein translocase subunit SecF